MIPVNLDAVSTALVSWLLTYAIHSTILLGIAALLAVRYADEHAWLDLLWKAALLGPVVTASVQLGSNAIPLGGRWAIRAPAPAINEPAAAMPLQRDVVAAAAEETPPLGSSASPGAERINRRPETVPSASLGSGASERTTRWWPAAAILSWLTVAGLGLLGLGRRLRRLHRACGSGPAVSDEHLRETVDELREAANERAAIRLTTSQTCAVPLALAGRQIVVPERFLAELDAEHQRAALAHEVAHVVRRDPAWRILAGALERLFFFQPLNRLARAKLCDSAEFLCDEWAVRQTRAPLTLARCLSVVASWSTPVDDALAGGASAMARRDSPFVRRVARILNEPSMTARRPSAGWLLLPLGLVVAAAPLVSARRVSEPAAAPEPPAVSEAASLPEAVAQKGDASPPRVWSASEIARARNQVRLQAPPRPGDPLNDRWTWALAEARRQGIDSFWIVYTFATPTHARDVMITDTLDGTTMVSVGGRIEQSPDLVPLTDLLGVPAADGGAGNVTVLLRYRGARADAIDRAGYRSSRLGFDFGRTPVFSLGVATDAQSFERVRDIFTSARNEKVRLVLIELASLHPDSSAVLPFLERLVEPSNPTPIRHEAAEGFGHHHVPRSVDMLLRVAGTDAVSDVRAEAAETIGEVQVPQSIPALTDLATQSPDPEVRREAAEAFGDQPPGLALPALEQLIATSPHDDVLMEAVEALGSIHDARVIDVLIRTATTHPNRRAQQEAVETLGDVESADAVATLARIAWEHPDVTIQREAVETLGDRQEPAAVAELERIVRDHPVEDVQAEAIETLGDAADRGLNNLVLEQALSGRTPRLRREALDTLAGLASGTTDAQTLDRIEQTLERAIFNDPDRSVRKDAIDALSELPRDRASRVLRKILQGHPDADIRQYVKQ